MSTETSRVRPASWTLYVAAMLAVASLADRPAQAQRAGDGAVVKAAARGRADGASNLLKPDRWRPWGAGYEVQDGAFVCENGGSSRASRGATQHVVLNQKQPVPIVARASSKAEGVSGSPDSEYSLYLDLVYDDGSTVWGQATPFKTGTHDW